MRRILILSFLVSMTASLAGAQFVAPGGSIPVVGTFQNVLDAPVVLMGFGLPDDNLHAPNEKFTLECFYRGMKTAIKFYQVLGTLA